MKQAFSLLILMLCMAIEATAQSGAIIGTVLDEKKEPMIGATIIVLEGKVVKGGTATDVDGTYMVKPLAPGRYDLKVTANGYKTHLVTGVLVSPDKNTKVDVSMQPNSKKLKATTVTAYKVPLIDPYADGRSYRTAEEIEKMPTRTTDAIMGTHAGAPAPQSGKALKIQGGRANSSNYVIDGVQSRAQVYQMPAYQPPVYFNPSNESYKKDAENDFKTVRANPLSTLSVDVDRASYSNIRRSLNQGQKPPADAVRVEEMINYFDYHYPQPTGNDPIAIVTEMIDCPWKAGHKLLHIGMQAKTISTEKLPPSNIVFLIDVSGSMMEQNKLPLVKSALKLLVNKLREQDRLSIVVYAGAAGMVLPPTPGSDKEKIFAALDQLQAGGSTAGGAGIKLAYQTAYDNFMKGGNNRVVLATDGDFNVGVSGDNELEDLITKERDKGIFLTCLGFGMGNYKDSKMEVLADKGNGNYAYIDNIEEAEKTLVKEFGGTIFTIAKDVKAQIEFNPAYVQSYRLVGYENRILNEEDFKDDKKDAGDMGSGHTVTIMYEIVPAGAGSPDTRSVDPLKYQQAWESAGNNAELATIKFRYKRPNANKSTEMVYTISNNTKQLMLSSNNTRFAASVAMFGMLLKDSKYKGSSDYKTALALAKSSKGKDKNGYRAECISLIKKAGNLSDEDEDDDKSMLGWNGE